MLRESALKKGINTSISALLALTFLGGVIKLQLPNLKDREDGINKAEYVKQERIKQANLELLKQLPDFGYKNLLADWIYLDFVQYYGDWNAREEIGYSLIPDYFELVVDKDPRFLTAQFYLAPANSLFAGRPEITVSLLNKSLESILPTQDLAYQVWIYKGIDELLFLGDTEAAKNSYEMAAKWAKIENTEGSLMAGKRAEETAKFLAKNPDSRVARASSWAMILGNARDEQTREIALDNLKKTGAKVTITTTDGMTRISVSPPEED